MDGSRTTTGARESDARYSALNDSAASDGALRDSPSRNGTALDDAPCDTASRVGGIGHALFRVGRAHRVAAARLLREIGLYPGQEIMLGHLADHGETRQSRLVAEIGTDPSTVTKMLQRLERAGFVERRPDPADRRVSVVALTAQGRDLQGRIEDSWRRLDAITCDGFSGADREQFAVLLDRLERNLATCQEE
ncbi:MarR family winged helix-turn-helix transcriptional regulator [Glycomyces harbinensis]|uniref:DNA-binding transcriptional regulator, MarR family n=1 Tax=Glycomyces harbinensis TaxID=58114 RepID=A0A1G6RJF9_9ACTN|nr:MarR family winged helix-turn-helix transcriptional regulator [Glycomyces harbinensis]SDD04698.1 DNA-binding transcriptional regulator, MarR family [Glycomyces harbinensis]